MKGVIRARLLSPGAIVFLRKLGCMLLYDNRYMVYPKGTPVPTPTVEVQVLETRVDLSNDMTWRQMIGVGAEQVRGARQGRRAPGRDCSKFDV